MKSQEYRQRFAYYSFSTFFIFLFLFTYAFASPVSYPLTGWRKSTPEEQGIQSNRLADMMEYIQKKQYNIDSITVVRNGHIVLDAYFWLYIKDQKHDIASCTKSITSALIGIAMDKDFISDIDRSVLDFFKDKAFANIDSHKRSMTIEHLLTMASGLKCRDTYLHQFEGLHEMKNSNDWVQYVLDLPMSDPPGKKFEYCNGVSFLLSAIIRNATKMSTLDFAKKYLFTPLDIVNVDWEISPQGNHLGYGEMSLKPHDMAKIGWLYLNKGRWGNKQLISSAWVEASTQGYFDAKPFDH
jgi:CubicO group peptidase (beta-lactamase class C family)